MKKIAIIGGGPAALILAAHLDAKKYKVTLFERKKAVARKFLVAGEGGLNLTFNSPLEELIAQYSPSAFMDPVIRQFTNQDVIHWLDSLGVSTFIGSSNRVFPELTLKPIEVLNKIMECIRANDIEIQVNKKWIGWKENGNLSFENLEQEEFDITVFALGGASWKVTGSDGEWSDIFEKRGVNVEPFRSANCAFGIEWEENFKTTHIGKPLKNISVTFGDHVAKGELVITEFGLEGNAIYAVSHKVQERLRTQESAVIHLDLKPTLTVDQLKVKYKKSNYTKITDILKQDIHLDRTSIGILKHFSNKETFLDPNLLVETIKSVPVRIHSADELDKAISSLGGISLEEITKNFALKKIPDSFVIGEMLDWYAPTGGYLLQGCFSMGYALASHLNEVKN